jgi:tetratricopeptide (TPR) repeat protein
MCGGARQPLRRNKTPDDPRFILGRIATAVLAAALVVTTRASAAEVKVKGGTRLFPVQHEGDIARFNPNVFYGPLPPLDKPEQRVTKEMKIDFNTRIKSDRSGSAVIRFLLDDLRVELSRNSILDVIRAEDAHASLELHEGAMHVLSRGPPQVLDFATPHGRGSALGTEYEVRVEGDQTVITVFEGIVEVQANNTTNRVPVRSDQQSIVRPGEVPEARPIKAENVIEWWLYYPGVLDPEEVQFDAAERARLAASLQAYTKGDPVEAFRQLPPDDAVESAAAATYRAALDLAVGNIAGVRTRLSSLAVDAPLPTALRTVIAAVTRKIETQPPQPRTASEWLALSYWHQARHELDRALDAGRHATQSSTNFGYAWARVAELEFGHGRTSKAAEAMENALRIAPQNAPAHAVQGFVFAAQNRMRSALAEFEEALDLNYRLGDAWLGRGLCLIRQGKVAEGRDDLQTAVLMESNRSLLRSYLGKAFSDSGRFLNTTTEDHLATNELAIARSLDTNDPTPWLYSALLNRDRNRINLAISELERSIELNTNRAVYRSRFLLDEDRAVRSSSLANIYDSAGMTEVSLREAASAVTYDYGNYSAHLFLAQSLNALRDPTRFNLRHETAWFNELLLANMLSPVGGTPLSQHSSQQEYSRLFERDRIGLSSFTEYRSDGQIREVASQFGTIGNAEWSLDLDYQHNNGVRPNNELNRVEWYTTLKQQLTLQDSVMLLTKYQDYHSGDNFQYYDPTNARPNFRFDEYQSPIILGGYHHEWRPGVHTLLLAGRLENEQHFSDRAAPQLLLIPSDPYASDFVPFDVQYRGKLEIYTAELNQIFQWNRLTLSAGTRYQSGTFDTAARLYNPAKLDGFFEAGATNATSATDVFERLTGYGYLTVEPLDRLWLTAGLAYDDITYPRNFRNPPLSPGEDHRSELGPKAAVVWEPVPQATLRGIFTRSLGGVSLDESYRLEPTQLAGFPQTFRTLISESAVGSVSAPEFKTYGLALDLRFSSGTYAGVTVERLEADVRRSIGVFVPTAVAGSGFVPPFIPSSTDERLNYRENALALTLNQLLGEEFVLGMSYKLTQTELHDVLPEVPVSALATADLTKRADLHQASGYVLFNHRSGFFARAETHWYHQSNSGDPNVGPGDDFFQHNLFAGYRFAHRHAEILLGILNLAGQDYHLNPLTIYAELPRERTVVARLRFEF